MFVQSCAKKKYQPSAIIGSRATKNGFVRGATATNVFLIFWTLSLFQPVFVQQTLPKAQRTRGLSSSCQSHIASSNTNLDRISSSES